MGVEAVHEHSKEETSFVMWFLWGEEGRGEGSGREERRGKEKKTFAFVMCINNPSQSFHSSLFPPLLVISKVRWELGTRCIPLLSRGPPCHEWFLHFQLHAIQCSNSSSCISVEWKLQHHLTIRHSVSLNAEVLQYAKGEGRTSASPSAALQYRRKSRGCELLGNVGDVYKACRRSRGSETCLVTDDDTK
jgi:hypothetical protein